MALIHPLSSESVQSGLDLFCVPPTQTSVEEGHYVEVYPIASLSQGAPIDFLISGATADYLDLNNTYLHIQAKITKADGTDLDQDENVAPVNNFLHSLFSQVDISLNGVLVSASENTYPYRALLETLLNFGPEELSRGHAQTALFAQDTAGRLDDTQGTNNTGLTRRRTAAALSRPIDLLGRLHADLLHQDKYMINGVDIKIRLTPSKNSFCLMGHGANPNYRAIITYASLMVRKAKVNPAVTLAHAKALEKGTVKYPVKRVLLKSFSVPAGNLSAVQDNLFLSHTPKKLVVCMVDAAALNGDYALNPFNFRNMNLNFLGVTVDGRSVPAKPLTPDFEGGRLARSYMTTLSGSGALTRNNGFSFTQEDFARGYAIFCFDLSPSLIDGDQWELVRSSTLRLELKFLQALPRATVVLVYGETDGIIEIDKSRQVLTDFAP